MRRQIFCVTCDVEMIFPACSGFQENLFRKTICSACGHDARLHSKEAIEDLVNSYAKDVKLDYAEEVCICNGGVCTICAAVSRFFFFPSSFFFFPLLLVLFF